MQAIPHYPSITDIYHSMTICAQFVKFHAEDSAGEIFYRYFGKSQIVEHCELNTSVSVNARNHHLLCVVNNVLTGDLTIHQTAFRLLHHSVFLPGKCGATFSSTYASELLLHQTCLCIWLPEQVHIHLCPFQGNVQCLQEAGSEAAREH